MSEVPATLEKAKNVLTEWGAPIGGFIAGWFLGYVPANRISTWMNNTIRARLDGQNIAHAQFLANSHVIAWGITAAIFAGVGVVLQKKFAVGEHAWVARTAAFACYGIAARSALGMVNMQGA
jgi:hypothetical protein